MTQPRRILSLGLFTAVGRIRLFSILAIALGLLSARPAAAQLVYASDGGSEKAIWVIDGLTNPPTNTPGRTLIPTSQFPGPIVVTPDGKTAFVAGLCVGSTSGSVLVVDLVNRTELSPISVPGCPARIRPYFGTTEIVITPDGSQVYVALTNESVAVINPVSYSLSTTIANVGSSPISGIAMSADGQTLYVAAESGPTNVISTASNIVTGTIPPTFNAVDPSGNFWQIKGSGVSVVTMAGNSVASFAISSNCSQGPVGFTPDGTKAYVADAEPECGGQIYPFDITLSPPMLGLNFNFPCPAPNTDPTCGFAPTEQFAFSSDSKVGYIEDRSGVLAFDTTKPTAQFYEMDGFVNSAGSGLSDIQGIAVAPLNNTPLGSPAPVPATNLNGGATPVTVTFTNVTKAGFTSLRITSSGPPAPSGFGFGTPPAYYNISTTTIFSSAIVCITAAPIPLGSRLFHYSGTPPTPTDVTDPNYPQGNVICSVPLTSLSPFGIGQPAALTQTSIGLSSSSNPSLAGQTVTFTSGVNGTGTSGSGTPAPSGSVTFFDGSTLLGSPVALPTGGGPATLIISTLTAGSHTLTAQYSGDTNYAPSSSNMVTQVVNLNTTAIGLSSSPNPSFAGQTVTFTSGISSTGSPAPGVPPPGGTVTFLEGGTPIASPVFLPTGGGPATLMISTLAAGSHTITAQYSGDNNYASSSSNSITQAVNKTPTVIGLSASATSSAAGQPITFTSAVSLTGTGSGAGVPPPSGSVTFLDNGSLLGPGVSLPSNNGGPVMLTTSSLTLGLHNITAQYSGDADYNGSTSTAIQVTITNPATATALVSSSSTSVYGQGVTFTATVTSAAGSPGGSVNFFDGSTSLGSGILNSSGIAMLTTSSLSAGTHSITASYGATGIFLASTSTALSEMVSVAPLSITINSFSRQYGQTNPQLGGTISGLQNGDNITANYNTIATPPSPVGSYSITATLSDPNGKLANYAVKTTNGTLTITPAPLMIAANNRIKTYGQAIAFAGNEFTSSGLLNADSVASVTLASAGAAASASVAGSPYVITPTAAVGTGLGNYSINFVNGTLTVIQASTITALTASPDPSNFGQSVTLTATVAPVAPGAGTATGKVTFFDGSTALGTSILSTADVATFSTSALAAGNHSLTATYSGDPNFSGSSSSAQGDQVQCGVLISLSPSTAPEGGTITVTGKVISCSTTTEMVVVKFSLSGPSQPNSCSNTKSEMFTTPPFPLPPKTAQTVSFPFKVPSKGVCPGTYSITATTLVNGVAVDTSTASLTITAH